MSRRRRYVRQFKYDVFRGMDIFFSHSKTIKGRLIRFACLWSKGARAAWRQRRDTGLPNHGGFLTTQWGQVFASEMTARGMMENPLDKYRTRKHHLNAVYRWRGFDDPEVRKLGEMRMAELRRRGKKGRPKKRYDWWGAITSSTLGRLIFRRKKQDPERDFCTENVCEVLKYCGYNGDTLPARPHPMKLQKWMEANPAFARLADWQHSL